MILLSHTCVYSEHLPTKRSSSKQSNAYVIDDHLDLDSIIVNAPIASKTAPSTTSATGSKSSTSTPTKSHHKSLEHEQLARHKSLLQNLTVYLGVCAHNAGMINRGLSTLLAYRQRCKKTGGRLDIADVQLYNILLVGYAGDANLGKVREILALMREDSIAPVAGTYAAVFECLGRLAMAKQCDVEVRRLLREYELDAKRHVSVSCSSLPPAWN